MVQTDQGSNFMSQVFAQVLNQLNIKHCHSSAYHPESQRALERFHQTLKTMLRTYCLEFDKDWEEGIHMQMFTIREVVQESLGFRPAELVFAHTIRGPLKILRERWLCEGTEQNLPDYVSKFRLRLRRACEMATGNLEAVQARMKGLFDRWAKGRKFQPGDKVLVLLQIPGSSLQARYCRAYLVQKKVGDGDYLVATPDRRRRSRLCHINMLKPYYERGPVVANGGGVDATVTPGELSSAKAAGPHVSLVTGRGAGELTSAEVSDGRVLAAALNEGKLSNSEILHDLPAHFSHLSVSQCSALVELIESNRALFADVPTQTHLLKHKY